MKIHSHFSFNPSYPRLGFGGRLLLAFSLVAATIVVAGFVSWIAFGSLGNVINQIEEHNYPAINLSAELAKKGAAVVATAPLLITSKNDDERSRTWSNLRVLFLDMASLSKELNKYSDNPDAIKKLNDLIDRITENLIELDYQIKQKLSFSIRILEKTDRLRWIHADFLDEVDPMVADARFNLESAMEKIGQSSRLSKNQDEFYIFKKESAKQEAILRVNALGNLVVGLLARGSSAPDLETLNDTVHFHGEAAAILKRNLAGLKDVTSAISLRQVTNEIIHLGIGDENLFSMREKQLISLQKGVHLLKANRHLVEDLRSVIAQQVDAAQQDSQTAMAKSEHLVTQGKVLLMGAMMLSLLTAILVGWFYVARSLVVRIKDLSESMNSIASGNLQTPVPTGGRDEISSMAESLLVFRNTAIEMEEANAQAIIDNAQVGLITTDMDGKIEFFNPTAIILFGYERGSSLAEFFQDLITGGNLNQIQEFFDTSSYKKNKRMMALKTTARCWDGSSIPINIFISAFKQRHKKKYIITLYDLTEHQKAESILEQRVRERTHDLYQANEELQREIKERRTAQAVLQKAQEELVQAGKLAALGKMAAGIAHEFNQPLTAIRSYAHNMGRLIELERSDEAKDVLDRIAMLARRMAITSKHLKSLARRPDKKAGQICLEATLNQSVALFEEQVKTHEISLNVTFPDEDVVVVGEEVPLEQVFTNLISNAIDAMKDQPERNLDIGISIKKQLKEVHIVFADTGKGMDKKELSQVFDPFYTSKTVGEGLGLGLSIAYNIVKDWQGALQVESKPGIGSTFLLILRTE